MTNTRRALVWVADHDDGTHRAAVVTHGDSPDTVGVWKTQPHASRKAVVDEAAGQAIDSIGLPCRLTAPTGADAQPDEHGNVCVLVVEPDPIPVGASEIADRLGVQGATVYQWRQRGLLPAPDLTVSGGDAWWWSTIEAWATATGRVLEA